MEPATGIGERHPEVHVSNVEGDWVVDTPVGRFVAPDEAGAHWLKIWLERSNETTSGGW